MTDLSRREAFKLAAAAAALPMAAQVAELATPAVSASAAPALDDYSAFVLAQLHSIACSVGIPYEQLIAPWGCGERP